jgi:hypothetical protein
MTKYKLISTLTLAAVMALPARAAPDRDPITKAEIADAISCAGMTISAEQVTLLTDVVARTSTPALKVQSMEPWGDHRMRVRLDCVTSEECLPFYVAVRWSQENAVQPVSIASSRSSTEISRGRPDPNSFVVRSGAPAVLLLDGNHVHIQIAVICLENGVTGQTIRVSSKDHRQTYAAEIFDGGVLRGRL